MRNNNTMSAFKFEAKSVIDAIQKARWVSGYGGYHTANPDAKHPKPYTHVTYNDIINMVKNPGAVPKEQAQWAIFSTTGGHQARVHQYQRKNGEYSALWGDIDKTEGLTFLDVVKRVIAAVPQYHHIIYTSKSATKDNPKTRVILPMAVDIPGSDYEMFARIFNNRLNASGLPPDRATERPGQLCYLPNRGAYYKFQINDGPPLNPYEEFKDELIAEQARLKKEQEQRERRHRDAIKRVQERISTGQTDPIEAFRQAYPVDLALEHYGYHRRGKKYLSPLSESGKPGVTILNNKWCSHHSSDVSIGQQKDGITWGDAFDLFVYYEHGGDFNQAVKCAGDLFTTTDQTTGQIISITKANQRAYMRQQDTHEQTSRQRKNTKPLTPLPLERVVDEPEPYPMDALGPILGPAAKKMNEVIQAPDGICAQSVLGFAAHAVQGFANVTLDGRDYPLNEFFLTVGGRSSRKTECDNKAGLIHSKIQQALLRQYRTEYKAYDDEKQVYERERQTILASKQTLAEKNKALFDLRQKEPVPPNEPVIMFGDPTIEGIHWLYTNGTPSKYLCADEGGQVSGGHSMSAEKKLYSITTYSKWWDGAPIPRLRRGDGFSILYNRRLSAHLMMQDKVARTFLNDSEMTDQGLRSRFLISYPKSLEGKRLYNATDITRLPDMVTYFNQLESILDIPLPLKTDEETSLELNELEPRTICLDSEACQMWVELYNEIEKKSGPGRDFESISGFAGKAPNHLIRLAGIMALFEDVHRKTIPVEYIGRASELIEYYLNERLRIVKISEPDQDLENAKVLLKWIQKKGLKVLTLPDVYQRGPSRFRTKNQASKVIQVLESHLWIERINDGGVSEITQKKNADAWRLIDGEV